MDWNRYIKELADKLIDRNLIPSLFDEQGILWLERWYKVSDPEQASDSMTEEDWKDYISAQQGMAYYQDIEISL